MLGKLVSILAAILAACIVMIIHELPKSIAYLVLNPTQAQKDKKYIFKLQQYIDPIGLIFFVTCYAGFSKPYMYRIKDKKTNLTLGIVGFLSSVFMFLVNMGTYFIVYSRISIFPKTIEGYVLFFGYKLVFFMAIFSLTMIIVNCFPLSTFDISLIIASKSPSKYFGLIQKEYFTKLILLIFIAFGIIRELAMFIFMI